jgi:mono/diheme cytochrome c family protein
MRLLGIAALLLSSAVGSALCQEVGDPVRGADYAALNCAECHAVEADDMDSPDPEAPPFQAIAGNPEMSELALVVFFQTPHPSMPDLIVPASDAHDLIAYIRRLSR